MSERYVDFELLPNGNLKMTLLPGAREAFVESGEDNEFEAPPLEDVIEYQLCNGWEWVTALDIGALLDDTYPMLTDNATRDSRTNDLLDCPDLYHYPLWAIRNPVEELFRNGFVIFTHEDNRMISDSDAEQAHCRYQVGQVLLYQQNSFFLPVQVIVRSRYVTADTEAHYIVETLGEYWGEVYGLNEKELLASTVVGCAD